MKKLFILVLTVFLFTACTSNFTKYRLDVRYNKLPNKIGSGSLVYGKIFSNLPVREVIIMRVSDGKKFTAQLVPGSTGANYKTFYIANVPAGKYKLFKVAASTVEITSAYKRYKFMMHTFPNGSKLTLNIKKDTTQFVGHIAFLKANTRRIIKRLYPKSIILKDESEESDELLVAVLIKDKKSNELQKKDTVKIIQDFQPNSNWLSFFPKEYFTQE